METYATPRAFRMALEDRLNGRAPDQLLLDRLRRRVVFERLLARMVREQPGQWIVKGGTALEIRMSERSRRTKDLDLATRLDARDGDALRSSIVAALAADPFGDWFEFEVGDAQALALDEAGRPGWRYLVNANLDGRSFARTSVDVVARVEEIASTEHVAFPSLVAFAGLAPVEVEIVNRCQHFAEKLHAYVRVYEARVNTRTRDIVDMVLLIEDGLPPDVALYETVEHVFEARGSAQPPEVFPDPPAGWEGTYEKLAAGMDIEPRDLGAAVGLVGTFWATTVAAAKE